MGEQAACLENIRRSDLYLQKLGENALTLATHRAALGWVERRLEFEDISMKFMNNLRDSFGRNSTDIPQTLIRDVFARTLTLPHGVSLQRLHLLHSRGGRQMVGNAVYKLVELGALEVTDTEAKTLSLRPTQLSLMTLVEHQGEADFVLNVARKLDSDFEISRLYAFIEDTQVLNTAPLNASDDC